MWQIYLLLASSFIISEEISALSIYKKLDGEDGDYWNNFPQILQRRILSRTNNLPVTFNQFGLTNWNPEQLYGGQNPQVARNLAEAEESQDGDFANDSVDSGTLNNDQRDEEEKNENGDQSLLIQKRFGRVHYRERKAISDDDGTGRPVGGSRLISKSAKGSPKVLFKMRMFG